MRAVSTGEEAGATSRYSHRLIAGETTKDSSSAEHFDTTVAHTWRGERKADHNEEAK